MRVKLALAVIAIAASSTPDSAAAFCGSPDGVAFGDQPAVRAANNARVFWTTETKIHKALAVRLDNANDRFVVLRSTEPDVSVEGCLRSGAYLRLATAGFLDYLIADTNINSAVVKIGSEFGPPKYKGDGIFFIQKLGGSKGDLIRYGDTFRIRGTTGNAWLCQSCGNQSLIGLNQADSKATGWRFVK
jgi:hypothetical protein